MFKSSNYQEAKKTSLGFYYYFFKAAYLKRQQIS